LLLFNCGNRPGQRLEKRGTLVQYQTGARSCSFVKSMQIETGIHKHFYSIGPGDKQLWREVDKHQRHSRKMEVEPAVAVLTVRIAAVLTDSCAYTFCWYRRYQIQQHIQIAAFCVSHVGICTV